MSAKLDLVLVNPSNRRRAYQTLGHELAAVEPPVWARLLASFGIRRGLSVVIIDADLQDPPEVILEFLAKWLDGYDVAYGVRTDRDGETPFKRLTAKFFYRFIGHLSDTRIPTDTGDFRLIDRRVVDALRQLTKDTDKRVRDQCAAY